MSLSISVLVLTLLTVSSASLPPPERQYNILMLLPVGSKSHRNVFMPLATALTERGHKITMLSANDPPDNNPNISYIRNHMYFDIDNSDLFEMAGTPSKMFALFSEIFPHEANKLYENPEVMELYYRRNEFDLIVIDHLFNEAAFPFVHNQTFISICTGKLDPSLSAVMGNVLNPSYVNNFLDEYPHPMTFVERIKNLLFSIMVPITWSRSVMDRVQEVITRKFPELPPLKEIQRNLSLTLINSHFTFEKPLPLLPGQVEVGGMHLRPPKPLPKELAEFLSGSTPVVYMSLGSIAKSSSIPENSLKAFIAVFKKLPYKVLWKFEDDIEGLTENIYVNKWMPQIDVLAHPNVKLFISHCGMLGSQEALYFGKPILGLPIFGDQPKNAKALEKAGVALWLRWEDLNEDALISTIEELMMNERYTNEAARVGLTFRDQLETPIDRAVFWTEYVIRHKGATHLRSPAQDLSWVQLLYLDALLLFHVLVFVFVKVIKVLLAKCTGKRKKSKKE